MELGPGGLSRATALLEIFETVTVVDGSEELLAKIPPLPGITKVQSLFEEFGPEERFDCILADHVLEHVEDPLKVLRRIKSWLAPGGVVIIGVPNGNSSHRLAAVKMGLLSSQFDLNERDHILGHRRVYSLPRLEKEVDRCGLRVVESAGVFLKPFSNNQINDFFSEEMILGFYKLGKEFPDIAAEIYLACSGNK